MNKFYVLTNLLLILCGSVRADSWLDHVKKNQPQFDVDYHCNDNYTNYQAKNEKGLAYLIYIVNEKGVDFAGQSISLDGLMDYDLSGHEWVPIGTADHPFRGKINGCNRNIIGMRITEKGSDEDVFAGLFGYVVQDNYNTVEIHSFNLWSDKGASIDVSSSAGCYAGALIGKLIIENGNEVKIQNCKNSVPVTARSTSHDPEHLSVAGGLVGMIESTGSNLYMNFSGECHNYGTITSVACEAACAVSGGILGLYNASSSTNLSIENGQCFGNVISESALGDSYAGGYVGWMLATSGRIQMNTPKIRAITVSATSESGLAAAACVMARADVMGVEARLSNPEYNGDYQTIGHITSPLIAINNGFGYNFNDPVQPEINFGTLIDLDKVTGNESPDISISGFNTLENGAYPSASIGVTLTNNARFTVINGRDNRLIYNKDGSTSVRRDGTDSRANVINVNIEDGCKVLFLNFDVNHLVLGEDVSMFTLTEEQVKTESVEMHDGVILSEHGIDNRGAIIYHRQPSCYSTGEGDGWETICLPFEAEIYADNERVIFFGTQASTNGDLWIRTLSDIGTATEVGFAFLGTDGLTIPAMQPCIISFPGESKKWDDYCSLRGKHITYRGVGKVKNENNDFLSGSFSKSDYYHFKVSGWNQKHHDEVYMLDADSEVDGSFSPADNNGCKFELSSKKMNPFRCFIKSESAVMPQVLRIASGGTAATGLETELYGKTETVYSRDGVIYLSAVTEAEIIVCDCYGRVVRMLLVKPGLNMIDGLASGIYIVNNTKVII